MRRSTASPCQAARRRSWGRRRACRPGTGRRRRAGPGRQHRAVRPTATRPRRRRQLVPAGEKANASARRAARRARDARRSRRARGRAGRRRRWSSAAAGPRRAERVRTTRARRPSSRQRTWPVRVSTTRTRSGPRRRARPQRGRAAVRRQASSSGAEEGVPAAGLSSPTSRTVSSPGRRTRPNSCPDAASRSRAARVDVLAHDGPRVGAQAEVRIGARGVSVRTTTGAPARRRGRARSPAARRPGDHHERRASRLHRTSANSPEGLDDMFRRPPLRTPRGPRSPSRPRPCRTSRPRHRVTIASLRRAGHGAAPPIDRAPLAAGPRTDITPMMRRSVHYCA